jgi:endo-1,3-1,4-beta-glycanase ExoK
MIVQRHPLSFVEPRCPLRVIGCMVMAALTACSEGHVDRQGSGPNAPPTALEPPAPSGGTSAGPAQDQVSPPAVEGEAAEFELVWQDDFDTFDASRWQLMTHSWDTNLAQFSTQNVSVENGIAALRLTAEPADPGKPFRGVEMRSLETITYGKVEARIRLARGSGVVSSLVLIYTPWPADDWNELDIEYLGRYSDRVQLNSMVYLGPPTAPPVTESVSPTQYPQLATLDFDPSADFHVYAMEWTATEARFSVDGQMLHRWNAEIGRLKLPMNILLTIWASSAADWAGAIDPGTTAAAEYDWLKVYRWVDAPF